VKGSQLRQGVGGAGLGHVSSRSMASCVTGADAWAMLAVHVRDA